MRKSVPGESVAMVTTSGAGLIAATGGGDFFGSRAARARSIAGDSRVPQSLPRRLVRLSEMVARASVIAFFAFQLSAADARSELLILRKPLLFVTHFVVGNDTGDCRRRGRRLRRGAGGCGVTGSDSG